MLIYSYEYPTVVETDALSRQKFANSRFLIAVIDNAVNTCMGALTTFFKRGNRI